MVYVSSWQEYQEAAETLYTKAPNKVRYCVKWKPSESKLVLKITDDVTCLKYKTHSSIYLNRFEALNLSLMQKMQNRRPPPPTITSLSPPNASSSKTGDVPKSPAKEVKVEDASQSGTAAPGSGGVQGGALSGDGSVKDCKRMFRLSSLVD